uniref:Uncharacterized protein n=1 Tax=Tanacetum cinerariifolium TaxID=118510 RepID=A0A699KBY4_TANCI|nr:hypothetical protein [Tanacetum cinerariifolium]
MAPLSAAEQRHPWLRYHIEGYTMGIRHSYEQRLETIWSKPGNRVLVLDFEGLTLEMRQDLVLRLRMVYSRKGRMSDTELGLDVTDTLCFQMGGVRRRITWRYFILALRLHIEQEMAEDGFGDYDRLIPDKGDLRDYWIKISSGRDFVGLYLFRHAEGRKSRARLSGGYFLRCLAMHFGLGSPGTKEAAGCCSWLLQLAAAAGTYETDETGLAAEEVDEEISAPTQAPPPPPPAS